MTTTILASPSDVVVLGLIGVVTVVVSGAMTALVSVLSAAQRRSERREEYARQDAVAARVATNSTKLDTLTVAVDATHATGEQTHRLVNSAMTEQMEDRLADNELSLLVLHTLASANPSAQLSAAAQAMQVKIADQRAKLVARQEATRVADAVKLIALEPTAMPVQIINPDPVVVTLADPPTGGG